MAVGGARYSNDAVANDIRGLSIFHVASLLTVHFVFVRELVNTWSNFANSTTWVGLQCTMHVMPLAGISSFSIPCFHLSGCAC